MVIDYKLELQKLLRKLFQFESADLDFGIYRIMNQKREVIEKFIQKDLIEEIDKQYEELSKFNKLENEKEIEEIKKEIEKNLGKEALLQNGEINAIFINSPLIKKYKEKITLLNKQEFIENNINEIFNHLYQFFSRYYDEGDFISKRRFGKNEKYIIPYNGEEVILHWANNDQYYVKTTEWFTKYSFKIVDLVINFRIKNVEDEIGNKHSDEKRFFILDEKILEFNEKILNIYFNYRSLTDEEIKRLDKKTKQEEINEITIDKILEKAKELTKTIPSLNKTLIEKHLFIYTKRNTSDYFIHKNLKLYLLNELDFFIKNEILSLDNIDGYTPKNTIKLKTIRNISKQIINLLSQIEDFQKKLFEKKKFVINTEYMITLDKIPKSLYPIIINNKDQINSWLDVYNIMESEKGTLDYTLNKGLVINIDFLNKNQNIMLDTKFFNQSFKDELISHFEDLDNEIDGLLIKSENYHALNLMSNKFSSKIKCIYIDPPYNTETDEFIYKDNYKNSTWLTMLNDRLVLARELLSDEGVIFISIDDNEHSLLKILCDRIFGGENFICNFIWNKKNVVQNDARFISTNHEYILCYGKKKDIIEFNALPRTEAHNKRYENPDKDPKGPWTSVALQAKSGNKDSLYEITFPNGIYWKPVSGTYPRLSKENLLIAYNEGRIWFGKNGENVPRLKKYLSEVRSGVVSNSILLPNDVGSTQMAKEILKNILGENLFETPKPPELIKRFIRLINDNENSIILDFFAGSGTTAQSVIELNEIDNGNRKYIIVELADYLETIIIPRIKKLVFSKNWKKGIPKTRDKNSHFMKYIKLEDYDDTLNNIDFSVKKSIQSTLDKLDGNILSNILEFETKLNTIKLNVEKFQMPFDYSLYITNNNELIKTKIDLIETFNFILGMQIKREKTLKHEDTIYKIIHGVVNNKNTLVIWRNLENINLEKEKKFLEKEILPNFDYDMIYINSNSYIQDAVLIEREFLEKMYN